MYGLWHPQMVKFDKPGMVYDNMIGCSTLVYICVFCFQQIWIQQWSIFFPKPSSIILSIAMLVTIVTQLTPPRASLSLRFFEHGSRKVHHGELMIFIANQTSMAFRTWLGISSCDQGIDDMLVSWETTRHGRCTICFVLIGTTFINTAFFLVWEKQPDLEDLMGSS